MTDPYAPKPEMLDELPPPRTRRGLGMWLAPGLALAFLATIAYALTFSIQAAREAARRSQCLCNLCMVTMALHNYHASNGCLPPDFGVDDDGRPRCSWRVSILPYMERSDLFNAYNFSQPWDSPDNRTLIPRMPASYACPSRGRQATDGLASYVVIRGPGTMFPGAELVKYDDIKDGLSNTLAVVEVSNLDAPWTAPMDLDARTMSYRVNDPSRPSPSSRHPGGLNAALGDGRKFFLKDATPPDRLRALITIDGGEAIDLEEVLGAGK